MSIAALIVLGLIFLFCHSVDEEINRITCRAEDLLVECLSNSNNVATINAAMEKANATYGKSIANSHFSLTGKVVDVGFYSDTGEPYICMYYGGNPRKKLMITMSDTANATASFVGSLAKIDCDYCGTNFFEGAYTVWMDSGNNLAVPKPQVQYRYVPFYRS